jgi:hypothetical protein
MFPPHNNPEPAAVRLGAVALLSGVADNDKVANIYRTCLFLDFLETFY